MTAALWMFLWLLSQQNASTTIQGMVVRAGTTQPLSGETVGLWPTTRTTQAGVDGRFTFRNVPPGQYMLTVVHDGIKLQVKNARRGLIHSHAGTGTYVTVTIMERP